MSFLITLVVILCPVGVFCQFNMTAYRQMPPLYIFDDYDKCLDSEKSSSYCLVIGQILPNETSTLWHQIANFSSNTKRHFRHDYLYFGVCLNSCKEKISPWSPHRKEQLFGGGIKNTELTDYFTDINKRPSDTRVLHNRIINVCLNYKFEMQYALQLGSFVQYCVNNDPPSKFGLLEINFFVIIGILVIVALLSSLYDRHLKNKQPLPIQEDVFYQQPLPNRLETFLTSFSIYRNYYRLSKPSKSVLSKEMQFLETYRFFTTMLVVLGHVILCLKGIPTLNTDFMEKSFYKLESHIIISGTVIIQIFFVMSSFFLCFHFQQKMLIGFSKNPGIAEWAKLILYRYLRLVPSLGFVILLSASILPRLQDGPFWRHLTEAENILCRENWWANLLFINNFMLKKTCLHQTWYLAADFQLYVLFAGLLVFIARFPRTKNFILGSGVVISCLVTGMVTYYSELDAIHQETAESYRYLFWTNAKTFYEGYAPFYMNLGGFFCGTITAFIYIKYKNQNLDLKEKKTKLTILFYLCFPLAISLLLSGSLFHHFEVEKPSIWIALFAGLHRNIWAIMSSFMMLVMCFRIGSIAYKFSSIKIFVPLGRLSFQVFLIHTIVIRCIAGCIRQPIYLNIITVSTFVSASIIISFFFAFFLNMFVEMPLTNLINTALRTSVRPKTNKEEKEPTLMLRALN